MTPPGAVVVLALLCICTMHLCTVSSEYASDTVAPKRLAATLRWNRIANPEPITDALTALELDSGDGEWLSDLRALQDEEWAEMMVGLVASGVSLGARAKLRRIVNEPLAAFDGADAPVWQRTSSWQQHRQEDATKQLAAGPRRLQDSGISTDSIALMATATLGILSFIVQGRVSANEQTKQAQLDREQAQRDKDQAKAAKQLERVQDQMRLLINPILGDTVRRRHTFFFASPFSSLGWWWHIACLFPCASCVTHETAGRR
jgi:hypothetical protein